MSGLIAQVRAAQVRAGEDVVLANLQRQGLAPKVDRESEAVDLHLRDALYALRSALRNAEVVQFGDQFRGAVDEAIKQVEYTRGMLS